MPLAACLIGATDIEPFYSEERRNAVFLGRLINDQEGDCGGSRIFDSLSETGDLSTSLRERVGGRILDQEFEGCLGFSESRGGRRVSSRR